jgi:hypothetical protein
MHFLHWNDLFAVPANMAYGQVKLEALGDVGRDYIRIQASWLDLDGVGEVEACATIIIECIHVAPYELLVNQRL